MFQLKPAAADDDDDDLLAIKQAIHIDINKCLKDVEERVTAMEEKISL